MRETGLLAAEGAYALTPLGRDLQVALWPLIQWSEDWAKQTSAPPC